MQPLISLIAGSGRAVGLGYNPTYAGDFYDPASDPPGSALLLSSYASFAAAVTACRAAGVDLKVDVDKTLVASDLGQRNVRLWGVPVSGRRPQLTLSGVSFSSGTKALMYCYDGDCFARGVEFVGMGTVFGFAADTAYPATPYQHPADKDIPNGGVWPSGTQYYFVRGDSFGQSRCIPDTRTPQKNGTGTGVGWIGNPTITTWRVDDITVMSAQSTIILPGGHDAGVTFDIRDCTFTTCQIVCHAISDSVHLSPVHFHRNSLVGTYGGLNIECSVNCDAYVSGNEYYGCVIDPVTAVDRRQPGNNSHGMHTFFKMGVDRARHRDVRAHTIKVENNYCHDIQDVGASSDINSAVFIDFRNTNPDLITTGYSGPSDAPTISAALFSVYVAFNRCERMQSVNGQIDCNAVYMKPLGALIEMNIFDTCGGLDLNPTGIPVASGGSTRRGSEGYFIVCKNPGSWPTTNNDKRYFIIRHNLFRNPPAVLTAHNSPGPEDGGFSIKLEQFPFRTHLVENRFEDIKITAPSGTAAVFRPTENFALGIYGDDNWFVNCEMSGVGKLIRHHNASSTGNAWRFTGNKGFDEPGGAFAYSGPVSLIAPVSSANVSGNTVTTTNTGVPDPVATWPMYGAGGATPRLNIPSLPSSSTFDPVLYNGARVFVSTGALA